MKRGIAIGYALGLILTGAAIAWAQGGGCGQGNPNCVVPTPPLTDNSNRAANTSWVNQLFSGGFLNGIFNSVTASAIVDSKLTAGFVCSSSTGIFFSNATGACPGVSTTGSGADVLQNSPVLITPDIGAATASSITFIPSTSGIVGTTVGDNANPGVVGEYISQTVLQVSGLTLTSNFPKSISAITLTAGDWDVEAQCDFLFPSGTATLVVCSTGSTQNSIGTLPNNGGYVQIQGVTISSNVAVALPTGRQRFSLSSPSTIFFSVQTTSTASATAWGFIGARRMR